MAADDAHRQIYPTTIDELCNLNWRDFETFAIEVVKAAHGAEGVLFHQTQFSHDGGRDGEAEYVLGLGLGKEFHTIIRLWLEVKKRNKQSVQKKDLGSHLVDALRNDVHKVIFVSSTTFSSNMAEWIAGFARRCNLQFQLIEGTDLLALSGRFLTDGAAQPATASKPPRTPKQDSVAPQKDVTAHVSFSLQHGRPRLTKNNFAGLTTRPGQPVFLHIDFTVATLVTPFLGRFAVTAREPDLCGVYRWGAAADTPASVWITPGDNLCATYILWPRTSGPWSIRDFIVEIISDTRAPTVELSNEGVFSVSANVLPPSFLASAKQFNDSILELLDTPEKGGELLLCTLVAPPGLGKTYAVSRLREASASRRMNEFHFDCEVIRTDVDLLRSALMQLVPIPHSLLGDELVEPIQNWCQQIGLRPLLAERIAHEICQRSSSAERLTQEMRIEVLRVLFEASSKGCRLAIYIEDLHKASPSLMGVLSRLVTSLYQAAEVPGIVVMTSRPSPDGTSASDLWLSELLRLQESSHNHTLRSPGRSEAVALLRAAVPSLTEQHCNLLIDAVGTTPYALREALLYLLYREIIVRAGDHGYLLARPQSISSVLRSAALRDASRSRLKLFLRDAQQPLSLLLAAGACYGKRFPIGPAVEAAQVELSPWDLDELLQRSVEWGIAGIVADNLEWVEFDHDMIIVSLLEILPERSCRRISRDLLGKTEAVEARCRLAYISGDGDVCLAVATEAVDLAKQERRVSDVVEFNQLQLSILDPESPHAESVFEELASRSVVDEGLLRFGSPRLTRQPSPKEKRSRILPILFESLDCLSTIGSGSGSASEALITEARLIAEIDGHGGLIAKTTSLHGRLEFERNNPARALELHVEAEAQYASEDAVPVDRSENLIRLAICHRSLGDPNRSIQTLQKAMLICGRQNPVILNKIRNNIGAAYLKSDWLCVRHHWRRQVAIARRLGMMERVAHGLISLAFIDIFEGELANGIQRSLEGLRIAEDLGLDNQIVRSMLNLSVAAMIEGRYEEARAMLLRAEKTALVHRITRRLWRVFANLATLHELAGEEDQALARDLQVAGLIRDALSEGKIGRQLLPFLNIGLRWSDYHAEVLERVGAIPPKSFEELLGSIKNGEIGEIPGLMGNYFVALPIGRRFLLTE